MFDRSSVARHSREHSGRWRYAAGVILAAAISMTQPGGGSAPGASAGNPAPANPSAPPIVSPMAPEGPRITTQRPQTFSPARRRGPPPAGRRCLARRSHRREALRSRSTGPFRRRGDFRASGVGLTRFRHTQTMPRTGRGEYGTRSSPRRTPGAAHSLRCTIGGEGHE